MTTTAIQDVLHTADVYLESENMRETADKLGVSVWTVHHRLNHRLPKIHAELHKQVREKIERNLAERAAKGGRATLGHIKPRKLSPRWNNRNVI